MRDNTTSKLSEQIIAHTDRRVRLRLFCGDIVEGTVKYVAGTIPTVYMFNVVTTCDENDTRRVQRSAYVQLRRIESVEAV